MSIRVHDLAAELGMTSDELMGVLREMEIFVRSHMSALEEDKVARVRTRVERKRLEERRKKKGEGEVEARTTRRRAAPKKAEGAAKVGYEAKNYAPRKPFKLYVHLTDDDLGLTLLTALLLAPLPALHAAAPPRPEGKPNVVILFMDDMGYADPAIYGGAPGTTPNIDRLAGQGMPHLGDTTRGDMLARVNVILPTRLTPENAAYAFTRM